MYTLYRPKGWWDTIAVGPGTPFHVSDPVAAQELVNIGKVNGAIPGTDYNRAIQVISLKLWQDMCGFTPTAPSGEV